MRRAACRDLLQRLQLIKADWVTLTATVRCATKCIFLRH